MEPKFRVRIYLDGYPSDNVIWLDMNCQYEDIVVNVINRCGPVAKVDRIVDLNPKAIEPETFTDEYIREMSMGG